MKLKTALSFAAGVKLRLCPRACGGALALLWANQACFVRLCRIIEPSANGLPLLQIALNLGDAADIEQR